MKRIFIAALAVFSTPIPLSAGDADFIVKFGTSQSNLGIYDSGNSDLSDARPDGACGVGFGDVPGADEPTSLGDVYASTASNGLGVTAPFDSFNFAILRVFFSGFGGNCGPTRVLENFNASPIGFFDGETALWVEANGFSWISAEGIAIEDDGSSTPGIDFNASGDFVDELEEFEFFLVNLDLIADIDRGDEIVRAVTAQVDRRATEITDTAPLVGETFSAAQIAVQQCGRMTDFAKRYQSDAPILVREASRSIAQETCKVAGRMISQAGLAARVEASLSK